MVSPGYLQKPGMRLTDERIAPLSVSRDSDFDATRDPAGSLWLGADGTADRTCCRPPAVAGREEAGSWPRELTSAWKDGETWISIAPDVGHYCALPRPARRHPLLGMTHRPASLASWTGVNSDRKSTGLYRVKMHQVGGEP